MRGGRIWRGWMRREGRFSFSAHRAWSGECPPRRRHGGFSVRLGAPKSGSASEGNAKIVVVSCDESVAASLRGENADTDPTMPRERGHSGDHALSIGAWGGESGSAQPMGTAYWAAADHAGCTAHQHAIARAGLIGRSLPPSRERPTLGRGLRSDFAARSRSPGWRPRLVSSRGPNSTTRAKPAGTSSRGPTRAWAVAPPRAAFNPAKRLGSSARPRRRRARAR